MISYSTLGVNDTDRSIGFYDAFFALLGCERTTTSPTWTGCRKKGERSLLFLTRHFNHDTATSGNGTMLAFLADDRSAVDRCHAAALERGGVCEGPPGVREGMDPVFYAAYVRDPDGNKLCVYVRR